MPEKIRIGIVVSEFNYDITMMMLERAKAHAEFLGVEIAEVVTMPGVYDMPIAAKKLLKRKDIDGVVALGAVIKGETDHDQIIMQNAARKLADLSVEFEKPVGLGISGPGMTRLQAEDRIENAKNAVESVVKQIRALKGMDK
ncbi:MAG: 6,7-dimethyl-8-ribityllumazine synthase [Thermoplasmata archaeon]